MASSANSWDSSYVYGGVSDTDITDSYPHSGRTYYYAKDEGTSMATPAVAGIIGLWMQANHKLCTNDIKRILQTTAISDNFTNTVPNNTWGYGKIDAYTGIKQVLGLLPLNLITFTAQSDKDKALLQWVTTAETNTKSFTVERNTGAWVSIGIVVADDLPGTNSYRFIDNSPVTGLNLYRLKMADKDGTFTYSPVRKVEFDAATGFSVSPNPAKDYANISFKGVFTGEISLYDAVGRKAYSTSVNGVSSHQLPVSGLAAGVYVVSVKGKQNYFSQKLVIIK